MSLLLKGGIQLRKLIDKISHVGKPFLPPHCEATNIGYYNSFIVFNENGYNFNKNRVIYKDDGLGQRVMTVEKLRDKLMRNIYGCRMLRNSQYGYEDVRKDWNLVKHIVSEAGSIRPELRYDLRQMDYYDTFEELPADSKSAIRKLLSEDRSYFKEKLVDLDSLMTGIKHSRQQKLWGFEFDRLKRQSYEVVEYDLEKRGYVMELMVKELNKGRKTPLTREEAKISVLEKMRLKDSDLLEAMFQDFKTELSVIGRYRDKLNIEEAEKYFADIEKKLPLLKKKIDECTNIVQAYNIAGPIFNEGLRLLKPAVLKLTERNEESRFGNRVILRYLNYKYITSPIDDGKNTSLYSPLYYQLTKTFGKFPLLKIGMTLNLTALFITTLVFEKRVAKYEKEHNVVIGARSRYFFSREEKYKGGH